jgi:excisionase family DNA binding protein
MRIQIKNTTKEEQQIAGTYISLVRATSKKFKKNKSRFVKIKLTEGGDFLKIPKKAILMLFDILQNMAEGREFTLVPSDAEIGTQEAADMLKVSRPHLVKLLEQGTIPFKKAGTHRRIKLKHVVEFRKRREENRNKKLDFLTKQAQDLDLGY